MPENTNSNEIKIDDRIRSPRQLGSYMHATRPAAWIALCAIMLLMIGFMWWAATAEIEIASTAKAFTNNGYTICWVDAMDAVDIKPGLKVISSSTTGTVIEIDESADDVRDVAEIVGNLYFKEFTLKRDTNYYRVYLQMDEVLPDGVCDVKIVERRIVPGEYFLNLKGE